MPDFEDLRRISTSRVLLFHLIVDCESVNSYFSSAVPNMRLIVSLALTLFSGFALSAPQDYRTTPVPILKQINRHNDDGSYSYGYEGADGTYKIETKYPTGEVYGKYGYIGDDGKLREVEYGASKRGFEPAGSGINVAPPTLSNSIDPTSADFDDGEYREDPSVYYKKSSTPNRPVNTNKFQSSPSRTAFTNRFQSPAYQAAQPQYYQQQAQYYQPQPQPQPQYYQPQPQIQYYTPRFPQLTFDPAIFNGHPAANFDINTGSYTISYSG